MRGRVLLCREAPSLALPSEETGERDAGGEAASLREAPLPQTPSPEERLGIGLCVSLDLRAHVSWARFLVLGIVVTAADRAAATVRRVGDELLYISFVSIKRLHWQWYAS